MQQYRRYLKLAVLVTVALLGLCACGSGTPRQPDREIGQDVSLTPPFVATGAPDAGTQNSTQGQAGGSSGSDAPCSETHPHPIAESIAQTYAVGYEQVMTWFCAGHSFEDILVALETGAATGVPVETLLQMRSEQEWEQIWDAVGFTG